MKKIVALLLALVMVIGLVACGPKQPTQQTNPPADPTKAPAQSQAPADPTKAPAPAEPLKIEWWTNFGEANHPDMQKIVDAFNASQDRWELSFIYQGGAGDLLAKVQATKPEDLPAIFNGPVENIGLYATAEFCAPIQQFVDADPEGWHELETTYAGIKIGYQDTDGNQIGYPFGYSYGGLFYNATLLKEAGIDPASLQSTEDMYNACKKLVDGGYAKYGMGFHPDGYYFNVGIGREGLIAYNNDNGLKGERITECLYVSDSNVYNTIYTMLEYYQKMHAENLVMPYGTSAQGEVIPAFGAGDCAMFTGVVSYGKKVVNAVNGSFEIGFMPHFSATENGKRTGHPTGGTGCFIGNSGNQEAMQGAYEFIKFASQAKWAALWCESTGYLAPNEDTFNSAEYQDVLANLYPFYKDLYASMAEDDGSATNPFIPISSEMKSANKLCIQTVTSDPTASIEDAIKAACDTIQEAIDLYNMSNP